MSASLSLSGVSKFVGGRALVEDVDLAVKPGEVVGLLGPNGAGKTTLIKMATAQTVATSGTIHVLGEQLDDSGKLPSGVGVMVEQPSFLEHMTAAGHLTAMARLAGISLEFAGILRRVGLDPDDRRKVSRFSLGMRRRLAMAQMLFTQPRVAVLDEPTNGLDALGIIEFRALIADLAEQGTAVLMSSHLLGEVERSCSRIVLLNHGQVVGGVDLRRLERHRIRIGLADESDWPKLEALVPIKDLVRYGDFATFDSPLRIDSIVAEAVAGGIGIVHASLEPVDLEALLIDLARR